jgi:hypothetical protein
MHRSKWKKLSVDYILFGDRKEIFLLGTTFPHLQVSRGRKLIDQRRIFIFLGARKWNKHLLYIQIE